MISTVETGTMETDPISFRPQGAHAHRAILALDLGTTTGWVLRAPDSLITSGTASFRPSRYDSDSMRYGTARTIGDRGVKSHDHRMGKPGAFPEFSQAAGIGRGSRRSPPVPPYLREIGRRTPMTGRRRLSIEIEPQYADVIVRRLQAFAVETATLAETGRAFDALVTEQGEKNDGC